MRTSSRINLNVRTKRTTERKVVSMKTKTLYMHLVSGKPAYYQRNNQIYYAQHGIKRSDMFCSSLQQIRKEQEKSRLWRKKQGFHDEPGVYGYLRIRVS